MEDKTIAQIVEEECNDVAKKICKEYCKYGDQYREDQRKYDDKNPTFFEHCMNCPIIDWIK